MTKYRIMGNSVGEYRPEQRILLFFWTPWRGKIIDGVYYNELTFTDLTDARQFVEDCIVRDKAEKADRDHRKQVSKSWDQVWP